MFWVKIGVFVFVFCVFVLGVFGVVWEIDIV